MATYNISVTAAIIQPSLHVPNEIVNTIYTKVGDDGVKRLFFEEDVLNIEESINTSPQITRYQTTDKYNNPGLYFNRSVNDTVFSHTPVDTGDELGCIKFRGSDGAVFQDSRCSIAAVVVR